MKILVLSLLILPLQFAIAEDNFDYKKDVKLLQEVSGNDDHSIQKYNVKKLDTEKELAALIKEGVDYGECYNATSFVIDSASILYNSESMKKLGISTNDLYRMLEAEVGGPESYEYRKATTRILTDDENSYIVYSGYNKESSDPSESCLYYNFRVFRKDGKVIHLNFNRTD